MRQFILVKPNYRFAGFARTEWQIFSYIASVNDSDRVRWGSTSRLIFSGTFEDCVSVLDGKDYDVRGYKTGRKICQGHYTPAGVFTISKVKAG